MSTPVNYPYLPPINYEPHPNGMGHEFFWSMSHHKNRLAQIDDETGEEESYGSLLKKCVRTALKMRKKGLKKGDIITICSNNHLNSCVPWVAGLFIGVVVSSTDPSLSLQDTKHLLGQVCPKMFFVIPQSEELAERAVEEIGLETEIVVFGKSENNVSFEEFLGEDPEEEDFRPEEDVHNKETSVILFSSGTTGLAKGVCVNHYGLLGQSASLVLSGYTGRIRLSYASLYWISTVLIVTGTILYGNTRVLCPRWDHKEVWHVIERRKISFLFLAPIQVMMMLQAGRPDEINTTSLRDLLIAGGSLSWHYIESIRDLLPGTNVSVAYGQTEVAGMITYFKPNVRRDVILMMTKADSSGTAYPGFQYRIVDPETNQELGMNERGELRIKTDFQMNGYHNLSAEEAWDEEGWLRTGDVAYFDEDGCFYIVDRIKEMLKYQSWHVAPALLEGVLNTHPAVKMSVVIGIPHEVDGDHPMGVVVLKDNFNDVTPEEIIAFVNERVDDRQKLRGGVKFVNTIPMTPSGKPKRRVLRDMILSGAV